jgi:hypothetical protein
MFDNFLRGHPPSVTKEVGMSAGSITALVAAAIVLVVVAGTVVGISTRRRRLRERFGPEYDRVVAERQSRLLAEAELERRERRVQRLVLWDLSDEAREKYATRWAGVQQLFVDAAAEAVAAAQSLIDAIMQERGYPVTDYEQALADLSVQHASIIQHFRSTHDISLRATSGEVTTEELRATMLDYRELVDQLLTGDMGNDDVSRPGPAPAPSGGDSGGYLPDSG